MDPNYFNTNKITILHVIGSDIKCYGLLTLFFIKIQRPALDPVFLDYICTGLLEYYLQWNQLEGTRLVPQEAKDRNN